MGLQGGPDEEEEGEPSADRAGADVEPVAAPVNGPMRGWVAAALIVAVTATLVVPPLASWQSENQQKALSLSNMRRVANGCLMYMEDWDQRMPPPVQRLPDGTLWAWPRLVRPYVLLDDAFSNPTNPVRPFLNRPVLRDPVDQHAIDTSYALNRRFWNEFASGPFPVANLEIPEQTVLLAEAGRWARDPRHPRLSGGADGTALDTYGDTADRIAGSSPYPSVHGGQFGVVAADGHGIMTRVLYYTERDGPHDRLLGRLGDNIYNWNGGHANGHTEEPAHE